MYGNWNVEFVGDTKKERSIRAGMIGRFGHYNVRECGIAESRNELAIRVITEHVVMELNIMKAKM